jgi:hypothetical protein
LISIVKRRHAPRPNFLGSVFHGFGNLWLSLCEWLNSGFAVPRTTKLENDRTRERSSPGFLVCTRAWCMTSHTCFFGIFVVNKENLQLCVVFDVWCIKLDQ